MTILDVRRFDALTFDCYGTLVNWERGILDALTPLFASRGVPSPGADALLERFGRAESQVQAGPFLCYRDVLRAVARRLGTEEGFTLSEKQADAFAASVGAWPPFPDTVPALRQLAGRYRIAVVSNVDDDLFAGTAAQLEVAFDAVVTAQQVRSYKPAPAHFHEVLRRLGLPKERVLHVAQSLHHDVAPAKALGFACVWVNRRAGRKGPGATPLARAAPDLEVRDLAALARLAGVADAPQAR